MASFTTRFMVVRSNARDLMRDIDLMQTFWAGQQNLTAGAEQVSDVAAVTCLISAMEQSRHAMVLPVLAAQPWLQCSDVEERDALERFLNYLQSRCGHDQASEERLCNTVLASAEAALNQAVALVKEALQSRFFDGVELLYLQRSV